MRISDWSSDVCSSDLLPFTPETSKRDFKFAGPDAAVVLILSPIMRYMQQHAPDVRLTAVQLDMENLYTKLESGKIDLAAGMFPHLVQGIKRQRLFGFGYKIGRASCRERVCQYV